MGHRIPDGAEATTLRELISEARAAARELRNEIKAARDLSIHLTSGYQEYHDQEIKSLANVLTEESNHAASDLNHAIEQARIMITNQIMSGQAVFDPSTETVTIRWGAGAFDDQQPLPHPNLTRKGTRP